MMTALGCHTMGADTGSPIAPSTLPDEAVAVLDDLSEAELRAAIDYARDRLRFAHPSTVDQIEEQEGEAIDRIEKRNGYTEVVKRQPCTKGCDDCPHGPYLYHVHEEQHPDGSTHLHWTYLGRIKE